MIAAYFRKQRCQRRGSMSVGPRVFQDLLSGLAWQSGTGLPEIYEPDSEFSTPSRLRTRGNPAAIGHNTYRLIRLPLVGLSLIA
jgi:hypothetical protein